MSAVTVGLIFSVVVNEHRYEQSFDFFGLGTSFQGTRRTSMPYYLISPPMIPPHAGAFYSLLGQV